MSEKTIPEQMLDWAERLDKRSYLFSKDMLYNWLVKSALQVASLEADSEMLVLMYETNSDKFIDLTTAVDEHPENYGRACLCKTCQSYGD